MSLITFAEALNVLPLSDLFLQASVGCIGLRMNAILVRSGIYFIKVDRSSYVTCIQADPAMYHVQTLVLINALSLEFSRGRGDGRALMLTTLAVILNTSKRAESSSR